MKIVLVLLAITMIALPVAAQNNENSKDREAVKAVALNFQDAWNRHDMKALASLVADDVDFITVGGNRMRSKKEFEELHTKTHAMMFKESVLTTKNTEVKFIKPDVAVAHIEWGMKGDKGPDGAPRQPREGIMTWVLEKRKGKWLLTAAQNTNISAPMPHK